MGNKSVKHKLVNKNICDICNINLSKYKIKSNIMIYGDHNVCSDCIETEEKWLIGVNMHHSFTILKTY
jgi:hypothetical protein